MHRLHFRVHEHDGSNYGTLGTTLARTAKITLSPDHPDGRGEFLGSRGDSCHRPGRQLKLAGRFSKFDMTASTWFGRPMSDPMTRRSSANCSAAPSLVKRLNNSLAPRTASGLRPAISAASDCGFFPHHIFNNQINVVWSNGGDYSYIYTLIIRSGFKMRFWPGLRS